MVTRHAAAVGAFGGAVSALSQADSDAEGFADG